MIDGPCFTLLVYLCPQACAGDGFHNVPQGHYAVDPRHLVLLKGFQLQGEPC